MIQQMLRKLAEQAAQEQKHHEFCTHEMEKSTKSQASKQEAVQKITDRISAMDAELGQQEQAQATAAIQQYKDAQGLISTAMGVLKKHYEKAAKALVGNTKKADQPKKT